MRKVNRREATAAELREAILIFMGPPIEGFMKPEKLLDCYITTVVRQTRVGDHQLDAVGT